MRISVQLSKWQDEDAMTRAQFIQRKIKEWQKILQLTDWMITFSERARREDSEHFGLPMERIVKVAPALDLDRFHPNKGFKNMRTFFGVNFSPLR